MGIPGLPPALLNLPSGCAFNSRCPFAFDRCHEDVPAVQQLAPDRRAACHLYPEKATLPVLPTSVVMDAATPLETTGPAMEGAPATEETAG